MVLDKNYPVTHFSDGKESAIATPEPEDMATLPPLPTPSTDEIEDLDSAYPLYLGMVSYFVIRHPNVLTQKTYHRPITRSVVSSSLEYYYLLNQHLSANLTILSRYSETQLSARQPLSVQRLANLTGLQKAQSEFAMHHIGTYECLRMASENMEFDVLGLPNDTECSMWGQLRVSRNVFAHEFGTPQALRPGVYKGATRGLRVSYEKLMELVEANTLALEEQLEDEAIWSPPPPEEKVQVTEEELAAREKVQAAYDALMQQAWQNPVTNVSALDFQPSRLAKLAGYPRWACMVLLVGCYRRVGCIKWVVRSLEEWAGRVREQAEGSPFEEEEECAMAVVVAQAGDADRFEKDVGFCSKW